jgi:DNA-binding NarL/FixJ family response regulator
MVRVLVVGDHAVALAPLRAALAALPGVEPVIARAGGMTGVIDAVVLDQSLGDAPENGGLDELAAAHPDACLVVVALQHADRYRWLRVLPRGAGFAVRGAGTDTLRVIIRDLLRDLGPGERDRVHATLPTMPRSIA